MERETTERERVQRLLLEEMRVAYRRHEAGECTADEYVAALKRFAEFMVGGRIPRQLQDSRKGNDN
jgi:hypothetical protein